MWMRSSNMSEAERTRPAGHPSPARSRSVSESDVHCKHTKHTPPKTSERTTTGYDGISEDSGKGHSASGLSFFSEDEPSAACDEMDADDLFSVTVDVEEDMRSNSNDIWYCLLDSDCVFTRRCANALTFNSLVFRCYNVSVNFETKIPVFNKIYIKRVSYPQMARQNFIVKQVVYG